MIGRGSFKAQASTSFKISRDSWRCYLLYSDLSSGRNNNILPVQVEGKRCHEFKIKDEELGEVDLLLHTSHDERITHYGLQGRATNVVPVTSEEVRQLPGWYGGQDLLGRGAQFCKRPYS
ncbi:hypothetical protein BDR04DRAFT_689045 [Suillus decipiens]|nr:hypothetical protein BDR04DRAFT_689045 [Suillus decipiens]